MVISYIELVFQISVLRGQKSGLYILNAILTMEKLHRGNNGSWANVYCEGTVSGAEV